MIKHTVGGNITNKSWKIVLALLIALTTSVSTLGAGSDFTLGIFGNANMDDTIDEKDVAYVEGVIKGTNAATNLSDANYDGKTDSLDLAQIKLILDRDEKNLTLIDATGRIVTVDMPITKMMAYGQGFHQIVRTLKSEDLLVATDRDVQKVWSALFPELVGFPVWGSSDSRDYELIYKLHPDIFVTVVQAPQYSVSTTQQDDIEKLEPKGIKVIMLDNRHPEELRKTMRTLGYILNRRDEAEEFIDFFDGLINTITERTKAISDKDKPRVYIANTNQYSTMGKGTSYSKYVEMAGGISISNDNPSFDGLPSTDIDPEWLILQNPDVFVLRVGYNTIQGYGQDNLSVAKKVQADVLNTPELANVKAIKDGRVYLFGQATTEAASFLGIGYMAKWFYPELFEDLDMQAIHHEYLDRFQHIDYDVSTQGVFMYPTLYGPKD
jgi:iron complex transport system substrate-binding protein